MRKRFSVLAIVIVATMLIAPAVVAATTVKVTEDNVSDEWYVSAQRFTGAYAFVAGPGTPPIGAGSLEMTAQTGSDKLTFVTDNHIGTQLSQLTDLSYATYRSSSSTSPQHVVPSVNIFITNGGPNGDVALAPLVWEPTYAFPGAVDDDEWQVWDTGTDAPGGFAGGWWSTQTLGSMTAFASYVDWETVLGQNPHATILAIGVNVGSGPAGSFFGAVDAFSLTFDGDTTTYNFDIDTEAPNVEINAPSDGDVVQGDVNIRGTVTDDNPHHYWLVVQNSGGATVSGPGTVNEDESFTDALLHTWDTTTVADGVYTIRLDARDAYGNKDSGSISSISVTVNNIPDDKDQCKNGGWETFGNMSFKNQGQCIKYVNTGT